MKQNVCVIICAAGQGERAGFKKNKLLVPFQGSCALEKTISAFDFPMVDEIIVTASPSDQAEISTLCKNFSRVKVVLGGDTRTQSVYNALKIAQADIVLIHDGARPFITRQNIKNCIENVQTFGSAVASIPCADTIAVCQKNTIRSIPDRTTLRQIQTPQGFYHENILFAYERAFEEENPVYTDDSSVFARYCGLPHFYESEIENKKLTYASDFTNSYARCGFGVDTHAFGKAQDFIVLGGAKIPSHSGLVAHSDGDVLTHALMDAMLSGAGLKDIGHYFPDTDAQWKDESSLIMLEKVRDLIGEQGFTVKNASIAIQAETPRLAKYIDDIKNNLSNTLKIDCTNIGITAGTNEGLGYVGEGKGITVHAYVLLQEF